MFKSKLRAKVTQPLTKEYCQITSGFRSLEEADSFYDPNDIEYLICPRYVVLAALDSK